PRPSNPADGGSGLVSQRGQLFVSLETRSRSAAACPADADRAFAGGHHHAPPVDATLRARVMDGARLASRMVQDAVRRAIARRPKLPPVEEPLRAPPPRTNLVAHRSHWEPSVRAGVAGKGWGF